MREVRVWYEHGMQVFDRSTPFAPYVPGAVALGVLIGFAARRVVRNTAMWAFTVTGILGGFTTFSALALELNDLADADRLPLAALSAVVTMVAGIGATAIAGPTPETSV